MKYDFVVNYSLLKKGLDFTITHISPPIKPAKKEEGKALLEIGKLNAGIGYKINDKL